MLLSLSQLSPSLFCLYYGIFVFCHRFHRSNHLILLGITISLFCTNLFKYYFSIDVRNIEINHKSYFSNMVLRSKVDLILCPVKINNISLIKKIPKNSADFVIKMRGSYLLIFMIHIISSHKLYCLLLNEYGFHVILLMPLAAMPIVDDMDE